MDDKIQKLYDNLYDKGACLIAFSDVSGVQQAKGFPYAITIGYKLNDYILQGIDDKPTYEYFHHYRTVNACLDQLALYCQTYIQRLEYTSYMIPASQSSDSDRYAGAFPHKTAAVLSGSGWIGKSGLFVTPRWGSKIRLATVLTDYPLGVTNSPIVSGCGECNECVKACPAGAIVGKEYVGGQPRDTILDAEKCSRYMKEHFQNIGRGSVCGICIAVCPYNHLK